MQTINAVDRPPAEQKDENTHGGGADTITTPALKPNGRVTVDASSTITADAGAGSVAGSGSLPASLRARYEDIRLLGRGGMGTVYRAIDPRLNRLVALKLLLRVDVEHFSRFLQGARAQARVQHEHVCRVYEAGEADGEPYIVMQYIDGRPLNKVKDRMTLEQKVRVIREVAAALHEAHRIGLVHRDVKPGNILVDVGEDGSWKPYVVDFGLARDVAERGQTMSGAVLGTPSFMAPEQARGEIRALDRRTDVYSLGATLYDLLAGRPPFVAEELWAVVAMVAGEEAPQLGAVMKEVPGDLETIVMKCLERDPSRRYESAKALGDDLQRFLDGESIGARRDGVGYVLWKKARKHKLIALLSIASLIAVAVPLGLWVKAMRDATEQVAFTREISEDVRAMELFLRTAYVLPLHDVEKERDIVRERLAAIERKMSEAGEIGEGPGSYALGRGYLALAEPEKAREHLTRAVAHGYTSPDLELALGTALGEIYGQALEATKRIENKEEQAAKVRAIEADLRDPALAHLRRAAGTAVGSPAYANGLIAFYEGKFEEALVKARKAFEKASWLYEAKKLEGDAQYALGSRYRHDAAFDHEKMTAHFGPAAEAYRAASEIARSDPEAHRAECELFTQIMMGEGFTGRPMQASFEKAREACARAVGASSRDRRARAQRAFTHVMFAGMLVTNPSSGSDPEQTLKEAVRLAEEAVRASPEDAMAHYVLSIGRASEALWAGSRGHDGRASLELSITSQKEALRIDPRFVWAQQDLTQAYFMYGEFDLWDQLGVTPAMESGIKAAERLIALVPSRGISWSVKGSAHTVAAQALLSRGKSPEAHVEQILVAASEYLRVSGADDPDVYFLRARAHGLRALYEMAVGKDPRRSLEEAARNTEEQMRRLKAVLPTQTRGYVSIAEARYHLLRSEDPEPALARARDAYRRASEAAPWDTRMPTGRAYVEVLAIRWAIKQKKAKPAMFEAALDLLRPIVVEPRQNPSIYEVLAEIHALRAAWLLEGGHSPAEDIAQGLARAGEALSRSPRRAGAMVVKGNLHLLEARAARDRTARAEAARRAAEALESAFKNNPLLEREHRADLEEANRLR